MGAESFLTLQIADFAEGVDDRVAALLQAGTGITLTYNDGAGTLTIANTGLGGSTGSTDNRILRSDGTGGSTVQNSAVTIDDSGNISGLGTVGCGAINASGVVEVPAGTAAAPGLKVGSAAQTGLHSVTNQLHFDVNGVSRGRIDANGVFTIANVSLSDSGSYLAWLNGPFLYANVSNCLEQYNGNTPTAAQTNRLYNTRTSATNFEALQTQWASNQARIGTAVGSAGGTQRNLAFGTWTSAGTWQPFFLTDIVLGNVWIGVGAGQGATVYQSNIAIGLNALGNTSANNGNGITAVGSAALRYLDVANTSAAATAIGSGAGGRLRAAVTSVFVGADAGAGSGSFAARTTNTTAVGYEAGAGFDATTISDNSLFGYRAGFAITSGNQNTFIGSRTGDAVTTGSNNIAVGFDVDVDSATASNQINIGNVYYHDRISGAKSFSGLVTCQSGFVLASRTKAAVLASSTAVNSGRFQLSDAGLIGREVYPDGTNWRYASDDSIVT